MCIKTTGKHFTHVNTGDFIDLEALSVWFVARTLVRWHVDNHWNKVVWPQMWTTTGTTTWSLTTGLIRVLQDWYWLASLIKLGNFILLDF
jgi:hypothetical protein